MRKRRSIEEQIMALIERGELPRSEAHRCPYLEHREAQEEAFSIDALDPLLYHRLMDLGFRRSGRIIYRPRCEGCARCVQLRVPVQDFRPSKGQRRVARGLAGTRIEVGPPRLDDARLALYARYLAYQHPGSPQSDSAAALESFLYRSAVQTLEVAYSTPARQLFAISIVDACALSLSSVYHFFDPALAKASPGVYSVLREIELARAWRIPYYYLGFWVEGCAKMEYKANYFPHELCLGGNWLRRDTRGQPVPRVDAS